MADINPRAHTVLGNLCVCCGGGAPPYTSPSDRRKERRIQKGKRAKPRVLKPWKPEEWDAHFRWFPDAQCWVPFQRDLGWYCPAMTQYEREEDHSEDSGDEWYEGAGCSTGIKAHWTDEGWIHPEPPGPPQRGEGWRLVRLSVLQYLKRYCGDHRHPTLGLVPTFIRPNSNGYDCWNWS